MLRALLRWARTRWQHSVLQHMGYRAWTELCVFFTHGFQPEALQCDRMRRQHPRKEVLDFGCRRQAFLETQTRRRGGVIVLLRTVWLLHSRAHLLDKETPRLAMVSVVWKEVLEHDPCVASLASHVSSSFWQRHRCELIAAAAVILLGAGAMGDGSASLPVAFMAPAGQRLTLSPCLEAAFMVHRSSGRQCPHAVLRTGHLCTWQLKVHLPRAREAAVRPPHIPVLSSESSDRMTLPVLGTWPDTNTFGFYSV